MIATLARMRFDVPVVPDADQGREWLERELLEPVYHQSPSILQRILSWLGDLFDGAPQLDVAPPVVALGAAALVLAVVGIALWVAGPVRRSRGTRTAGALQSGDDRRSAAQLRADADAAAGRGDWDVAVADRFRALVRDLEDRTVLEMRPGRTAHEAVEAAGLRLPAHAADLRRAGRLFDDVVYGEVPASPDDDAWLRGVDRDIAHAPVAVAATLVLPSGWADPALSSTAPSSTGRSTP